MLIEATTGSRLANLPGSFRPMTALEAVRAAAARQPDKVALRMGDATLAYSDLVTRAERLRDAALARLGLRPGDTAAIVARNCLPYVEVVLGLPEAGIPVATINPRLSADEIGAIVRDSRARIVFADAASLSPLAAARLGPDVRIIPFDDAYERLLADIAPPPSLPDVEEWDVWTIPYTSGTTGQPKGVMISHRSRLLFSLVSASEYGCFGPDDCFLAVTALAFGAGLGFPLAALSTGGTVELIDQFDAEAVLRRLKSGIITGIFLVPTHFQMMFELPPRVLDECREPPIKAIVSNAAPLPQALKHKIVPYFGEGILHEIYGATEMGVVCGLRPAFQLVKERCVGTPQAHARVSIRNADGTECGVDEVGEIFVASPCLFNGYLHRPDETAAAFRDGWVSVGDLARRDADGFIYIVDRKKDMVISGGVNIYPREIEEVLLHHPAVREVAVVGIPDERWGEALKLWIAPREGQVLDADGVAAFCRDRLASYKVPRLLGILPALPRNANGKVLKTELRALG